MNQPEYLAYLKNWVESSGPIRFDALMSWLLYNPEFGYYHKSPGMSGGDFITAPEMGNLFAGALIDLVQNLSKEGNCRHLIEIGPGTGKLMASFWKAGQTQFSTYGLVEISDSLKKVQAETCHNVVNLAHFDLSQIPTQSVIMANEWLDALPVRRFKRQDGQLYEGFVDVAEQGLFWDWQPTTETLSHWPKVDGIFDVRDDAKILDGLKAAMPGSICILIDYGYHYNELSALPHLGDSLRGFYENRVESDVFKHLGQMDITADVNFSALAHQAADLGWSVTHYFKQSHWLIDYIKRYPNQTHKAWEVKQLIDPSEMGERVRCLILSDPSLSLPSLDFDECVRL